jgi:DNA-directed RNA polymerase specialized sigma24 family protein
LVTEFNPAQLLLVVLGAKLTPNQRDAFIDHVVLGRTTVALAREYGCSPSAVGHAARKARMKLESVVMEVAA